MNVTAPVSAVPASGSKLDNRRSLAALIDLAVVGAGAAAILAAAGVLGGDGALGAPLAAVVLCWGLYYYLACESGGGQTLGKKLMKLRVVRVDGRAASMPEIAVRSALRVVDTALVGLIAMLATGERRARLGDLLAGTMIVAADATVPSAAPAAVTEAPSSEGEPSPATPDFAGPAASDPLESEPVAGLPVAPHEGESAEELEWAGEEPLEMASPSLKELAHDVASATGAGSGEAEAQPEAELERMDTEPVVEVRPVDVEPVVEVQPVDVEPVVEAQPVGVEPVVEVEPVDAEPVAEVEADPVVEAEPADAAYPLVDAEPVVEAEPAVEVEPPSVASPEPSSGVGGQGSRAVDGQEGDGELTVRSVETVSAIDLIMGRDESSEGSQAGGQRSPDSPRE